MSDRLERKRLNAGVQNVQLCVRIEPIHAQINIHYMNCKFVYLFYAQCSSHTDMKVVVCMKQSKTAQVSWPLSSISIIYTEELICKKFSKKTFSNFLMIGKIDIFAFWDSGRKISYLCSNYALERYTLHSIQRRLKLFLFLQYSSTQIVNKLPRRVK